MRILTLSSQTITPSQDTPQKDNWSKFSTSRETYPVDFLPCYEEYPYRVFKQIIFQFWIVCIHDKEIFLLSKVFFSFFSSFPPNKNGWWTDGSWQTEGGWRMNGGWRTDGGWQTEGWWLDWRLTDGRLTDERAYGRTDWRTGRLTDQITDWRFDRRTHCLSDADGLTDGRIDRRSDGQKGNDGIESRRGSGS